MEEYFRKYYQSLCYFAVNLVHDRDLCEDIVQEVFVRVITSGMVFESELHFRQYVYAAVRNHCIDHINESQRVCKVTLGDADTADVPSPDYCDRSIVRAEIIRMVREAIDSLPPRYRQVFRMAYIDKMDSGEIAEALGISINTVKVIRQRAKNRMREMLSDFYPLFFILVDQLYR
ncbi:RNA polymerase sigma factor [uncultured Duncaniella sp.]|uniref:RNA polymerase sigma factor n=1 Tax=uncultured Duncaniella sp. TaxID=2768039 RepID=UPI0025DD1E3C|nr:sigma-70 family RNA polymerase sigma factor [uncultured Duncaniella sp.]